MNIAEKRKFGNANGSREKLRKDTKKKETPNTDEENRQKWGA